MSDIKLSAGDSFSIEDVFYALAAKSDDQMKAVKGLLDKKLLDQKELAQLNLEVSKWQNMVSLTSNMTANYKEMMKSIISNIR